MHPSARSAHRPSLVLVRLMRESLTNSNSLATVRRAATRRIAPRYLSALLACVLQACAAPTDGVTGGGGKGTGTVPTRFESSIGALNLTSVGASQTISTTARDARGNAISGVQVTWTSSDLTVVDVAGNGTTAVVTARAPGSATVRARTGDLVLEIGISVLAVRAITVTPNAVSVIAGGQLPLNAAVDADAGALLDLRWLSDNPSIAAVNAQGVVTGVAPGNTIVRVNAVGDARVTTTAHVTVTSAGSIALSPSTLALGSGEQRALSASINLEPGLSTALTWRSTNNAVATVSSTGVVTGVSVGSTLITAVSVADTTRRGSAAVTVIPVVRDIDVTPSAASIFTGDTRQLGVSFTADQGASEAVIWRSSNATVASVSASGLVSGVSAGTAIVTAISAADTTKRATSLFTVRYAAAVSVSPSAATIGVGSTRPIVATVVTENGATTAVTWRTGNAAVATVSSTGVVTGVGMGTTEITAVAVADTSRRAASTITVAPVVRSVSVSPTTSGMIVGSTLQLVPSVVADAGVSTALSYRSTNSAVATVNASGLITAVAEGTTRVIVASVADTMQRDTATVSVANGMASTWAATRLGGALFEDVLAIHTVSATSAFAINLIGDVYRWNGSTWTLSARGSSFGTQFLDVHGSSATNIVAVGTNGIIARFDGSIWMPVESNSTNRLNGVFMENSSSGFAVGENGTALRWNGTSWNSSSTGSTQSLRAVWSSGGIAFAVGASGEVLRYSGVQWSRQTVGTTETLLAVSGSGTSSVVVTGTYGTIVEFDGAAWAAVRSSTVLGDVYDVSATPDYGVFYLAGDDGLFRLSGPTVTRVTTPYAPRLFSVSVAGSGALLTGGQRGTVQRFVDSQWETISLAPDLIDAWTTSATNAWAVGEFGFVYRWNGSAWTRQSTPTTATLNAVWGASSSEAFAAGDNGTMLRFNGTAWSAMSFPSTASVYGLWGSSATNVFAVTSAGEVVRYNGSTWSVVATAGSALWAIHGSSATDVFATGENGVALRFTGSGWSNAAVNTTGTLAGVWASGSGATSVGAASSGSSGIAFSYGSSWSPMTTGSSRVLTSVWGPSSSDLYATGDAGTLLRYNGSSWSAMTSGTTDLLWSVTGAPSGIGGAFAVGYNSTVVAGSNSAPFMAGMARAMTTIRKADLDPAAGARLVRGPLPSGKARKGHRGKR